MILYLLGYENSYDSYTSDADEEIEQSIKNSSYETDYDYTENDWYYIYIYKCLIIKTMSK